MDWLLISDRNDALPNDLGDRGTRFYSSSVAMVTEYGSDIVGGGVWVGRAPRGYANVLRYSPAFRVQLAEIQYTV